VNFGLRRKWELFGSGFPPFSLQFLQDLRFKSLNGMLLFEELLFEDKSTPNSTATGVGTKLPSKSGRPARKCPAAWLRCAGLQGRKLPRRSCAKRPAKKAGSADAHVVNVRLFMVESACRQRESALNAVCPLTHFVRRWAREETEFDAR
jgi:hypothetical protein